MLKTPKSGRDALLRVQVDNRQRINELVEAAFRSGLRRRRRRLLSRSWWRLHVFYIPALFDTRLEVSLYVIPVIVGPNVSLDRYAGLPLIVKYLDKHLLGSLLITEEY